MSELSKPEEFVLRKVVSMVEEEGGYAVLLECGHESFWAIDPPQQTAYCSQCLDLLIDKLRESKP
jgi:hypothetical protein